MIFLVSSVISLMLIAIINYIFVKDVMNPSFIYSLIWMFQLIGLIVFKDYFIETSGAALLLIVAGVLIFSLGSFFGLFLSRNSIISIPSRTVKYKNKIYIILCVVAIIFVFMQYQIFTVATPGGDFGEKLIAARTLITYDDIDLFGIYKYGTIIALIPLGAAVILYLKNKSRITLCIALCLLACSIAMGIFSTGRGKVLESFMLVFSILIVYHKGQFFSFRNFVALIVIITITVLIFWIMGAAMEKASDNLADVFDDMIQYQFGSVPAFSLFLQQHPLVFFGGDFGANTFRFFFALFEKIGLANKPVTLIQEFVYVPMPTNIYGIYHLYIKDFGFIGMFLFTFIIGAVHGIIFYCARLKKDNDYAKILLAFSILIMSKVVGGEGYFTALSYWIQVALMIFLITNKKSKNASCTPSRAISE